MVTMSNDLVRLSRAVQLAQNDMSPARETDLVVAERWGVTDRTVREVRNSEEYSAIANELRTKTLAVVADSAERMQRMAAQRAEALIEKLADVAAQQLEPKQVGNRTIEPDYKAINAVLGVARLLIEVAEFSRPGPTPQSPTGPGVRMPRLIEAKSTRLDQVRVEYDIPESGDVIDGECSIE